MVQGVSQGFVKTLELVGVGYRAQMQGNDLVLNVVLSSLESVGLTTSRVFSSCLKVILSSKVLVNSPLVLKVN
jgi:hypothetical protein